jgi:hypothetical protein
MWTCRITGTSMYQTPCFSIKHHYVTFRLVCGLLVQLQLFGLFFFWDYKFTPICYTLLPPIFKHVTLLENLCLISLRQSISSHCQPYYAVFTECFWSNNKHALWASMFATTEHVHMIFYLLSMLKDKLCSNNPHPTPILKKQSGCGFQFCQKYINMQWATYFLDVTWARGLNAGIFCTCFKHGRWKSNTNCNTLK